MIMQTICFCGALRSVQSLKVWWCDLGMRSGPAFFPLALPFRRGCPPPFYRRVCWQCRYFSWRSTGDGLDWLASTCSNVQTWGEKWPHAREKTTTGISLGKPWQKLLSEWIFNKISLHLWYNMICVCIEFHNIDFHIYTFCSVIWYNMYIIIDNTNKFIIYF